VHRRGFRFIGPVAPAPDVVEASPRPAAVRAATTPRAAATLVGRESERARLHALLEQALRGDRQLVFVTGEPGIGKTALVETLLADVGDTNGVRIGRGQCVEHYGPGEAYLPVLEALGRLGRAPAGEQLVQVLKQHAPTWLEQLPGLLKDRDVESVRRRAEDATRGRMLRELAEALDALTLDAPLVLLLEDLHWSDSATIDLLGMLARRREPSRLLVVATYRPADAAVAAHPLRWLKHELQAHGRCEEIALAFLGAHDVARYLSLRFPGHALPAELAPVLHRKTEGNPLFLVNTIDDLIDQGQLRESDGRWQLSAPAEDIAARAPETLWQLVEKHLERLTPEEQAVLVAASVAGIEFSAAVVSVAGLEARHGDLTCEALARRGQFLRAAGIAEWPDGSVAGRYAFIHALYQQVLYARIAAGERVGLHLRYADRLERGYGERSGEIAGELAVHFEHGRNLERAAKYRGEASEHALRRHAYREAVDHATRGLEALLAVTESPQRAQHELTLRVTLATALTATKGYGAPEVADTYARAWELCAQVGDTWQLWPVLRGLGRFYTIRGQFQTARDVGAHLLSVAEGRGDAALLVMGRNALGIASLYAGDFQNGLDHLERALNLYHSEQQSHTSSPVYRLVPPEVTCAIHAAWALWMLGYADRSAVRAREALALARALGHPFSISYACHLAAALHHWRREHDVVQALEDEALAHDTEYGFALLLASGVIQRGWLLTERGERDKGLAQMQDGLRRYREVGAVTIVPAFLCLVADTQERLGRPAEALATMSDALTLAQRSGQHYWEAELYRLTGALTLRAQDSRDAAAMAAAETSFRQAVEIARRQRAKWLELRAAISLGRLWAAQGDVTSAHALLSDVYGWFTEGFETVDLRTAKTLLEQLKA
jgi:predicted ATPase